MTKSIFVNLRVEDLPHTMAFYEAIGFTNNQAFTDETAAGMVWSDTINVMLLTHDKWKTFTDGPFAETAEQSGGYYIIDVDHLDEAISIASRLPPVSKGTVEIRPLFPLTELPLDDSKYITPAIVKGEYP